jgi:20S proteasome subunit beta 2
MQIAQDAVLAGVFNDLGSGSNVDLVVFEKGKVDFYRNYRTPNQRPPKELSYKYPRGTTGMLFSCLTYQKKKKKLMPFAFPIGVLKQSVRDLVTVTEHVEAMAID